MKGIMLSNGKEIRDWMQANEPKHEEMKVVNMSDFLKMTEAELRNRRKPRDGNYYSVEHTIFCPLGNPLLSVGRVYIGHTAMEALQQYLFGCASQFTGKGTDAAFTKLWDNFAYQMQEIQVELLPDGEYFEH